VTAAGQAPAGRATARIAAGDYVAGAAARSIAASAVWPIALVISCAVCLRAQSGAQWLSGALIVACVAVLDRLLGIPQRAWMPTPVRWLLPLSVIVAAAGLLAEPARSGDWLSSTVGVEAAVLVMLTGVGVWSRIACRRQADAPTLQFPLREGVWRVVEGEGRLLNHHWRAPTQRAALDLVRLGRNGMSHRGLNADQVGNFFAYGTPVFSPGDGWVVACSDGQEDTRAPGGPAGNYVLLEIEGAHVMLAHFAKGSLLVQAGQQVRAGTQIARVGNSGNSSEPHLHIHAAVGDRPLRLRFSGRRRRFPRGSTIRT
jgi:hypothetical protein